MTFPGSEKFGMTEASTKRVGMGLITFYILSIGAILAVLYAELGKLFKSKLWQEEQKASKSMQALWQISPSYCLSSS